MCRLGSEFLHERSDYVKDEPDDENTRQWLELFGTFWDFVHEIEVMKSSHSCRRLDRQQRVRAFGVT
jgi:hypothetical protein